jgi:hypothetical protein
MEWTIVLLPVILVLAKQCGWNAMFLGRVDPGEAQCSADLLRNVILHLTLLNVVGESARRHVPKDLVFLDCSSVQLLETECSVAARCEGCSGTAALRHPCVVWLATRHVGWVLLARPIDYVEIVA